MSSQTKRRPRKREQETEAELHVLFPHKDVTLQNGEVVAVRPWDLDTGAILMPRLIAMLEKLQGRRGAISLDEMIASAKDECFQIVAQTLGWTVAELRQRATFEDFLSLLQAVIDTSLVRENGGGTIPKIVGLAGALKPITRVASPA